jgi:hypothetical protein
VKVDAEGIDQRSLSAERVPKCSYNRGHKIRPQRKLDCIGGEVSKVPIWALSLYGKIELTVPAVPLLIWAGRAPVQDVMSQTWRCRASWQSDGGTGSMPDPRH